MSPEGPTGERKVIFQDLTLGLFLKAISEALGVHYTTISKVINGDKN